MPEHDLHTALRNAIGDFVDDLVRYPAVKLVDLDFEAQDDVANILVLFRLLRQIAGSVPDAAFARYIEHLSLPNDNHEDDIAALLASSLSDKEHLVELRSIYCSYVLNLSNAACLSILGNSYLSAFIVTRSLLELLVGIGSGTTGTMSEKIRALTMLAADEQKAVSDFWRELSGWAHPHQKWIKHLVPSRTGDAPMHDRELRRTATMYLSFCVDLAFAIAFAKFAVRQDVVRAHCESKHVDYRRFMFLARRLRSE